MSICQPFTPIKLWKISVMIVASWAWAFIVSSLSMDVLSDFLYKQYTTQVKCLKGYNVFAVDNGAPLVNIKKRFIFAYSLLMIFLFTYFTFTTVPLIILFILMF